MIQNGGGKIGLRSFIHRLTAPVPVGNIPNDPVKLVLVVNQELKITDWYIIRNQETGEAIPNDITTAREELRNQTVTVENEINALSNF